MYSTLKYSKVYTLFNIGTRVLSQNYGYLRIWSKYVGKILFPWIRNDLYIVDVLVV